VLNYAAFLLELHKRNTNRDVLSWKWHTGYFCLGESSHRLWFLYAFFFPSC